MIRVPPRTTQSSSSAASDVYKRQQKGLVWFSTWNGLNKFDGYTFKTYKTSQESKYAFGSNRMGTISESKYGDIWCPTYDGQACLFDVETEKFIDVLQPIEPVSYTHLRAHETRHDLVCRLLLEKKKIQKKKK